MVQQFPNSACGNGIAPKIWKIQSDVARADVYSIGASLHNLTFEMPDGKRIAPLAEAGWQTRFTDRADSGHPRHIELLGGEWPCVPFGTSCFDQAHHGYGTDNHWQLEFLSESQIQLSIEYPEGHVIRRLSRRIALQPGQPSVEMSLTITPRRGAVVPVGVHPVLKIPDGRWSLAPGKYRNASVLDDHATLAIDAPDRVAASDDGTFNPWHDPAAPFNGLVQLWFTDGSMELRASDTVTRLEWDRSAFPHCLLWFANPGLSIDGIAPGFRGVGIEPIHSFFDGTRQSRPAQIGTALTQAQDWTTCYRITCRNVTSQ